MPYRHLVLGGVALATTALPSLAHAQGYMTLPLVDQSDQTVLAVTYDLSMSVPTSSTLDEWCTTDQPCNNTTILIDTPLWRNNQNEINVFQADLSDIMSAVQSDRFTDTPAIVFTNFGDDDQSSLSAYEAIIREETDAAAVEVEIDGDKLTGVEG